MILEVNSSYFPARRYNLDDVQEVFLCLSSEGYISLSTEDDESTLAYLYVEKGYLHFCPLASDHAITHNNTLIDGDVRVSNYDMFQIKDSLLRSEKDSILRFEFAESKIILMIGLVQAAPKQKHVVKLINSQQSTTRPLSNKILATYAILIALIVLGLVLIILKKSSSPKPLDVDESNTQTVLQTSTDARTISLPQVSETMTQSPTKADDSQITKDIRMDVSVKAEENVKLEENAKAEENVNVDENVKLEENAKAEEKQAG